MARRAPAQERSIASMNRMLDAGEQLFYEGGNPALTLEAVIQRAETSTGSFYARFGDMSGFLDAMHERVLEMLAVELEAVFAEAAAEDDLESALRTFCLGAFDIVNRHRAQTYFFAIGNSQDQKWRAMGAQFAIGSIDAFTHMMKKHLPRSSSAANKRKVDMTGRTIIAAMFQQIMFDEGELSRVTISQKKIAEELAAMLCSYLRDSPTT